NTIHLVKERAAKNIAILNQAITELIFGGESSFGKTEKKYKKRTGIKAEKAPATLLQNNASWTVPASLYKEIAIVQQTATKAESA
ncbi:MAG: hypothetical protein KKF06_01200, partial [Candidatus Margulisbacteria bacterium]|nr:hypothetical protein [Candidatus Margulisiibacteriota bacterium]